MRCSICHGTTAAGAAIVIASLIPGLILTGARAQPAPAEHAAAGPGLSLPRSVLVSELIGMRVRTPSGERIGAIEDLVVSSSHAVSAAVVSVGGVLGVGAKRVELPLERLALDRDASIVVSMTREDLDALPPYSTQAYSLVPPAASRGGAAETPPAAARPDSHAQTEANAEAARSFAEDDPRVATGIAESNEAFDGDRPAGEAEQQ
jgi:sporulation protein YlmC with PRC-barrel domain